MRIEKRPLDDRLLLIVHGDIVSGQCDLLAERIRALMDRQRRHIVLDLSHVRYIDSRGVGALVNALTVARTGPARCVSSASPGGSTRCWWWRARCHPHRIAAA